MIPWYLARFLGIWPLRWVIHVGEQTHPGRVEIEIANPSFLRSNVIRISLMGHVGPSGG